MKIKTNNLAKLKNAADIQDFQRFVIACWTTSSVTDKLDRFSSSAAETMCVAIYDEDPRSMLPICDLAQDAGVDPELITATREGVAKFAK